MGREGTSTFREFSKRRNENLLPQTQAPTQFPGRDGAFLFYTASGSLYDLEELAVGAQSQSLFIRVADRNNGGKRFSSLKDDDRVFSRFGGVFRQWR